jgi:hypothetical protein
MYLRKSIVLVSLAAVIAAPSAFAQRPSIVHKAPTSTVCKGEGPYGPYACVAFGNPATHIPANVSGIQRKKAHQAQTSTVCKGEGPYGPYGCVAYGF